MATAARNANAQGRPGGQNAGADQSTRDARTVVSSAGGAKGDAVGLDHQDLARLSDLKSRDRQVRQQEQAHRAVGGPYSGPVVLQYVKGPDGRRYAASGEVTFDVSPVRGDLQATVAKMETVLAAALAPSEPSALDRATARQAQNALGEAIAQLRAEQLAAPERAPSAPPERALPAPPERALWAPKDNPYAEAAAVAADAGPRVSKRV
ncbi:MAG: putative metalloprotease CJM1_0395 family protein [Pseudomonadota bacterium]